MKSLILILATVIASLSVNAQMLEYPELEVLYQQLDSVLDNNDYYHKLKVAKIRDLQRAERNLRTPEERLWHNRRLYNEYFVYDADSAIRIVDANLRIARQCNDEISEYEWKINRSFMLSVMGQLKDASDELAGIDPGQLPKRLLSSYYDHKGYLFSHLSLLLDHRSEGARDYRVRSREYADSAFISVLSDNPLYLWYKASTKFDHPDQSEAVIEELESALKYSTLDTRIDALHAYALARLYDDRGDQRNRIKYLIYSGIADIKIDNRDIASLEELSIILFEQGDVDRAYNYLSYCKRQALALPNYLRAASTSKIEADVHQLYVSKLKTAGSKLRSTAIVLVCALVLLILLVVAIINRSVKLSRSRRELQKANQYLNDNIKGLSESKEQQQGTLDELKRANDQIVSINTELGKANYIKEECIGATLALCSTYFDKLDAYHKSVSRMVRANMWNELRGVASNPALTTDELKQFYKSFDKLFLSIHPNFVADFNALLRDEEQVSVKPGELNTELRIYALVRLGISDSVRIASVLHCSAQTIYNNRLKTRNKAKSKESFDDDVKNIGFLS